jgi:hypothetical protein
MVNKFIRNNKTSILSSNRLNDSLQIIKIKAHYPSCRLILEQICVPLAEILSTKGENASFSIYPSHDSILIQVYGKSIFSSGKLTAPIDDVLGIE